MCRMLLISSEHEFEVTPHLEAFAEMCRSSSEYQGDGWGMLAVNGTRSTVKHPTPIWQHDLSGFGSARLLLAHARSAFRDHPLGVEHNMPFVDDRYAFAFNGELHGVTLRSAGATGAAKIFDLLRRLDHGDPRLALERTVTLLERHSRHIRACNLILTDGARTWAYSRSTDQPDYFTLQLARRDGIVAVCSEPLADGLSWQPLPADTVEVIA
jgi:glutamine amidotransferase